MWIEPFTAQKVRRIDNLYGKIMLTDIDFKPQCPWNIINNRDLVTRFIKTIIRSMLYCGRRCCNMHGLASLLSANNPTCYTAS